MKRTSWTLAAVALGLLGAAARSDDVTWKPSNAVPVKAEKPAAPVTAPKAGSETPKSAIPNSQTSSEPQWKPSSGTAVTTAPITTPVLTDDGVWRASGQPATGSGIQQATYQVPVPEPLPAPTPVKPQPPKPNDVIPIPAPAPLPAPVPAPLPAPSPAPAILPKVQETPKRVVTMPAETKALPAPKPLSPVGPMTFSPTPSLPATDSTNVWGGYNNTLKPGGCVGETGETVIIDGERVPVRHGTFGSPGLRVSRDYHVLDAFTHPVTGDDERGIFKETASETVNDHYFAAEFLMWWVNAGKIPVLATTAGARMFGYLGEPGTTLLLGPGDFGDTYRNGIRLRAGTWLDDCQTCGLDASIFALGQRTTSADFDSAQHPTIARPFFAPNFNREFSELVAFPGLSTGHLNVTLKSDLWGADINFRKGITNECDRTCEWFLGYRYLQLKEKLTITENLVAQQNAPDPVGTTIVVRDQFGVTNSFNGGQVGGALSRRWGNYSVSARGSIALGTTHQELEIEGNQVRTRPGEQPVTFTGGLYAVGPNLGTFTRDRFSVLPEATVNLGYYVRPNLKMYVGYNFMTLTNVIRPGDQIDRVIDLTYIPNAPNVAFSGQARPQPLFKQSDLLVQGIQFGFEGSW
ncbi:hypothetical protein BH11PLA2_BH11PLA2_22930 [soil metagenome]